VDTGPATATLDDGTGRIRLGGPAASDALSLLEPGDAVEVTGLVSRDAYDWLIEVDPDRIVTLAGTGSGAAASSNGPPTEPLPPLRRHRTPQDRRVGRPMHAARRMGCRIPPAAGPAPTRSCSSLSWAAASRCSPSSGLRPRELPAGAGCAVSDGPRTPFAMSQKHRKSAPSDLTDARRSPSPREIAQCHRQRHA